MGHGLFVFKLIKPLRVHSGRADRSTIVLEENSHEAANVSLQGEDDPMIDYSVLNAFTVAHLPVVTWYSVTVTSDCTSSQRGPSFLPHRAAA